MLFSQHLVTFTFNKEINSIQKPKGLHPFQHGIIQNGKRFDVPRKKFDAGFRCRPKSKKFPGSRKINVRFDITSIHIHAFNITSSLYSRFLDAPQRRLDVAVRNFLSFSEGRRCGRIINDCGRRLPSLLTAESSRMSPPPLNANIMQQLPLQKFPHTVLGILHYGVCFSDNCASLRSRATINCDLWFMALGFFGAQSYVGA